MVEQALFNLATAVARAGNLSEARRLLDEAAEIDEAALDQVFSTAADPQRSAFLQTLRLRWNLYLSIVRRDGSPDAIRAGMNFVLRRRALGIEALVIQATMATANDQAPTALRFRQLNRLRRQAAEAELAVETEEKSGRLVELTRQAEALERELAAETPSLRLAARVRKADVDLVKTAMPASSALIEFVRVDADCFGLPSLGEEQPGARYVAFVGDTGSGPELVDLGPAENLEHEIRAYLAIITDPSAKGARARAAEAKAGKRLHRTILQPLRPAIAGCAEVIMAADGELSRLPLSVLPVGGGLRLIDQFAISYVTSGRDLLATPGGGPTNPGAPLVLGDPDYDACVEGAASDRLADLGPSNDRLSAVRSSGLRFAPLAATRGEAEVISALLKVTPHVGQMASYGTLSKTQSPSVLHIATHGFFLEDTHSDASLLHGAENPRMLQLSASENPLLRSGLALAGANIWLQDRDPGPELRPGIITAAELATLNFRDTFLVTLSACETGLGLVRAGEGVFGLQRACILAGAKTIVMSLWNVPDLATARLMKSFYGNIIAGQPVEAALRNAQQTLRQIHPDPLSWGAFVVLGAVPATRVSRLALDSATR
jgi:CHAT domain-containing protein